MKDRIKKAASATAIIGAASLSLYGILSPRTTSSALAQSQPVLEEEANAAWIMVRFGNDAHDVAAGGGVFSDAITAVSELAGMDTELASLADLESLRDEVAKDVVEIKTAIWRGGASSERLTALQSAESDLASRQAAVDQAEAALREDLRDHFVNSLGAENVALMDRFHANRDRRVPDAMKALDLTDSQWRTLESACVKSLRELTLTTEESALLAQCQSDQTTILVANRLATNLVAIEAVFHDALTGALE